MFDHGKRLAQLEESVDVLLKSLPIISKELSQATSVSKSAMDMANQASKLATSNTGSTTDSSLVNLQDLSKKVEIIAAMARNIQREQSDILNRIQNLEYLVEK